MCKPVIQEPVNVETTGDAMTNLYNFLPPTSNQDQLQLLSQSDSQINLKSTIVESANNQFCMCMSIHVMRSSKQKNQLAKTPYGSLCQNDTL